MPSVSVTASVKFEWGLHQGAYGSLISPEITKKSCINIHSIQLSGEDMKLRWLPQPPSDTHCAHFIALLSGHVARHLTGNPTYQAMS